MMKEKAFSILVIVVLILGVFNISVYATEDNDIDNSNGNTSEEWTDFSNAKLKIEQLSSVRKYKFTISDVTYNDKHTYYYAVNDGTTAPTFSNSLPQLHYDNTKKVFYSGNEIANYLELGKEQYVYVFEQYLSSDSEFLDKLVLEKVKLDKPTQKKYTDVFFATSIYKPTSSSNCDVQILFDTPWGDSTIRKVHLRIGKINDDNILKDIYNKNSNAFENLLNYSKTGAAFYDKTLNSNTDAYSSAGGIKLNESGNFFDASNITKDDYYFLYAVVEDENGKFVKTEGVTFARAGKSTIDNNNYTLFFYGSNNFTWKTFGETPTTNPTPTEKPTQAKDPTIATQQLPNTGVSFIIIISIFIASIIGTYSYRQYKKNNY